MTLYVVYERSTGRIKTSGEASSIELALLQMQDPATEGIILNEEARDDMHYVVDGALALRPDLDCEDSYSIAADGVDEVAFSLPAGSSIRHEGVTHSGADSFAFTTDVPGLYVFEINPPFPTIERKVTIHAV